MTLDGAPAIILDSHVHVLRSTIVDDDYELAVWLPPSYAGSAERYPALYLLDSPANFGFAIACIIGQIWEGLLPEMIVVGIGKPVASYDEWWPVRSRDYSPAPLPNDESSGHAVAFSLCLATELLPFVDRTYRTKPSDRAIWGHSLGGTFVLYMLLNESKLFYRYIATSPAVVEQGQVLIDAGLPLVGAALPAKLFVSVGSLDDEFLPHVEALETALRRRQYQGLQLSRATLVGYAHASAAPMGFMLGIRAVFAD
jgi:predicted alpha/beta superfamily hydrolase